MLILLNPEQPESEKEIQRLIEENLKGVLDMYFLASEYRTTNGRIDSLAVDADGAPVIIEYKRNRNDNVINQSLSYLKWLTAQRQEFFEMLMQKQLPEEVLENIKLDWKHPRIVCIAESFSQADIDTVEVVPLRIELFKYRQFAEGLFSIESITVNKLHENQVAADQTFPAETNQSIIQSMKELNGVITPIRVKFDELRERILALDRYVIEKAGKLGISYRLTKNFAEIKIRKDKLVISLRPIDYVDLKGMVERIVDGYVVTMNRRITVTDQSEMDYAFGIIEQSYLNVL